jgi:hypothetical protein
MFFVVSRCIPTGVVENAAPVMGRRGEGVGLEGDAAGIDDVVIRPGRDDDRKTRLDRRAHTVKDRFTGSYRHAKELIQRVNFRPDFFPGSWHHGHKLAIAAKELLFQPIRSLPAEGQGSEVGRRSASPAGNPFARPTTEKSSTSGSGFHRFAAFAGAFLDAAEEFVLFPFQILRIVIGELRPLLLEFAFDEIPIAFDFQFVHGNELSSRIGNGAMGENPTFRWAAGGVDPGFPRGAKGNPGPGGNFRPRGSGSSFGEVLRSGRNHPPITASGAPCGRCGRTNRGSRRYCCSNARSIRHRDSAPR